MMGFAEFAGFASFVDFVDSKSLRFCGKIELENEYI